MLVLLIGSLIVGQFQPGSPAPGFELERADGTGQVRLDQMRGRYVVVYFWLPSTENDAVDARELDAIRQGPGCDGVTVLTVLYPPDETASAMALLRKEDVGFDVLVGTDEVAEKYGADQTRALVVIDPGGVIDTISHRGMPAELYSYLERRTDEAACRWLDSLSVPEAEIDSARCRRVLASLDSFLRVFTSNKWPPEVGYLRMIPMYRLNMKTQADALADSMSAAYPNSPFTERALALKVKPPPPIGLLVTPPSQPAVSQLKPDSPASGFELDRADGTGQVRLDQMRGRYVVVYFWLPSTENDAVDARELDAIRQGPGRDGVTVLTVLYPPDETASAMALLRKEDVGFDVLVGTDEVAEKYGADQTRALVVIDPGGVIDTISHRGMPAELYSYLERRTDEAARRWLDSLSVPEAEIDSARCRRVLASLDSFLRVFTSNKWPPEVGYLRLIPMYRLSMKTQADALADSMSAAYPNSPFTEKARALKANPPVQSQVPPPPPPPPPSLGPPLSPLAAATVNLAVPGLGTAICGGFSTAARPSGFARFATVVSYLSLGALIADRAGQHGAHYLTATDRKQAQLVLKLELGTTAVSYLLNAIAGAAASHDWGYRRERARRR